LNYNSLLLVQLEQRVEKWNVHQCLGDIFLQIVGFLKIYSRYCSHYNEAMRVLTECKKQSRFKKFIEDLKKKSHDIEHRGLEDFLIRPVQRIPRYFLLLQDLVRHTSSDHPDYANLAAAAQKVQAIAEYMNEKKREAENIMKVTEIQEMIEGDCETLAKPHRRFVKESQLQEVTKGTVKKQAAVVFLFNDLLIITRPQGSSFLSRNKTQKLLFVSSFKLSGSQVVALDDTPGIENPFQNGFVFVRNASKRSITLLAATRELRDEWVASIEAEITGATRQEVEQDKRITSGVTDKVDEAKHELEKRMSNILSFPITELQQQDPSISQSLSSVSSISSASLSSSSSLSSTSSIDESSDGTSSNPGTVGRRSTMSLREKRLALMSQARKNSNTSGITLEVSAEKN